MRKLRQWQDDLGWKYDGWWAKVAFLLTNYLLALIELFYKPLRALVRLASAHYSVAGTASAAMKNPPNGSYLGPISSFGWAVLCAWGALVATALGVGLYSFRRFLSADECDVCSRVALRARLLGLAWEFTDAGLFRRSGVRHHTRCLLFMTRAGVLARRSVASSDVSRLVFFALCEVDEVEREGEQEQAGRIYKQAAELFSRLGDFSAARSAWDEAHRLFKQAGARDQLLKLGPCP